jgi:hypothetical protein
MLERSLDQMQLALDVVEVLRKFAVKKQFGIL